METFSALLAICAGKSPVTGVFPAKRPVTRSFDVFFDLRLNKRLGKQSWGWWFETSSHPLWRYCNDTFSVSLNESIGRVALFPIIKRKHITSNYQLAIEKQHDIVYAASLVPAGVRLSGDTGNFNFTDWIYLWCKRVRICSTSTDWNKRKRKQSRGDIFAE